MVRKVFEIEKGVWTVGSFYNGELLGGCQKKYKKRENAIKELNRLNKKYPLN